MKSRSGFAANGCVIAAGVFVAIILIAAIGIHQFISNGSFQVMIAKKLLETDPRIKVGKISGSVKSGFSLDYLEYTHESGNVSFVKDVGFNYKASGKKLVIKDVHVDSAYVFFDWESDEEDTETEASSDGDVTYNESGGSEDDFNLIIERVSINDITVENPKTGEKATLESLQMNQFIAGKDKAKLAHFELKSDHLNIEAYPADLNKRKTGEPDSLVAFKVQALTGLSTNIVKDIQLEGQLGTAPAGEDVLAIAGLDDKLKIELSEEKYTIVLNNLTPDNYIKLSSPLSDINIDVTGKVKEKKLIPGKMKNNNFKIGKHLFVIDESSLKGLFNDDDSEFSITARSTVQNKKYTYTLRFEDDETYQSLTSKPASSTEDNLSILLYGKEYKNLNNQNKAIVDDYAEDFED
ncbi:hypothetical protein BVX97_03100 [bacterium E08(2017)]|nr:hypothetical protein BVX97_03100 [bacterium E08(2017)]